MNNNNNAAVRKKIAAPYGIGYAKNRISLFCFDMFKFMNHKIIGYNYSKTPVTHACLSRYLG